MAETGHGAAFGLQIRCAFPAPGVMQAPASAAPAGRTLAARLGPVSERFRGAPLASARWANSRLDIGEGPDASLVFSHSYFGRFALDASGTQLRCDPTDLPEWQWQRFLVGQLLPAAALVHGLGPMHCAGVVVDGKAHLLLGASGAGKTTTLLHLMMGGATFLTDDVAALELREGHVLAHPGSGLANVDAGLLPSLPELGLPLGVSEGEVRLRLVAVHTRPVEVGSVWILDRNGASHRIEVVAGDPLSWPAALLGAHFNPVLADRSRPGGWLEIVEGLVASARLGIVRSPLQSDPHRIAAAMMAP